MRQFDVFDPPERRGNRRFFVVLQHDAVTSNETVVIAPCAPARNGPGASRLAPSVEINGQPYRVVVPELTAVSRNVVRGRAIANLEAHRDSFTAAIDYLFTGI